MGGIQIGIPDLSLIRRQRGISLQAIAESTKISARYLEAIEGGEFRKLPGGVYDVSYIRQYCNAIQYDEDELLRHYRASVPQPDAPAEPAPRPSLGERFHNLAAVLLLRQHPSAGER